MPLRNASGTLFHSDEEKTSAFADHLQNLFRPNPATNSFILPPLIEANLEPEEPIKFRPCELAKVIKEQLNQENHLPST